MEKFNNKKEPSSNRTLSSDLKNTNRSKKNELVPNPFILEKYKEYFKSFIRFKKYNSTHKTHLNSMYLQFRDRYQKYVTNKKNSFGLKLKGNKLYENLPINIFKDNYKINTFNISKELENKVLGYFFPFEKKENSVEKKLEGEKIKLTPIPYKNNVLINSIEEKNNITEAKRSAVLMRRVEYTHLIKNFGNKKIEENKNSTETDKLDLAGKIYILKGAIIIIEEWWKKIKSKRNKIKNKKKIMNKNKSYNNINNYYNFYPNKKTKEIFIDLDSNDLISKNNIIINGSNNTLKSESKNDNKKQNKLKLNIQNNYIVDTRIKEKTNSNTNNIKFNNNINKTTSFKNKIVDSYKKIENNEKNKNEKSFIKINENEKNKLSNNSNNKKINLYKNSETKINIKKNEKTKIKKPIKKETKSNNINNNINNNNKNSEYFNSTINIDSINKIRAKIYNAINKNKVNHIKNNRNNKNLQNNHISNTSNNKSTNFKSSYNQINNIKIKNHLKNKNPTKFVYDFKDIEKLNNSINSNQNINNKNKNKKEELYIKTNYDRDRKNIMINTDRNKLSNSTDVKSRNNFEKINLKNKYKTVDNTEIFLYNNNEETNDNKINNNIKYVESKENEIKLTGLSNIKNNNNNGDKNNEKNDLVININNDDNIISFRNNEKEPIENNKDIKINIKNEKQDNNNKIIKDIIQEDIDINRIIKKYSSYSFKDKRPKKYENIDTYRSGVIKALNESPTIRQNKTHNFSNTIQVQELSFLIKNKNKEDIDNKSKQFNNLEIIKNNESEFINDPNSKSQDKNNNINNKIFSKNKIQIEFKNNYNNENSNNMINIQTDDSNIIPIEQDKQRILIIDKLLKGYENKISHFHIFIQGKNYLNLNNTNNSNILTERDISDITYDDSDININLPKSGNYTLCQKIKELFPQNNNIIKREEEKNKFNNYEINGNNIHIKNFEIKESNNYYINFNNNKKRNIKRAKSENKNININKKNNYSFSLEVPEHIKNIYKLYKTKSAMRIPNKKYRNIEYIRILDHKFEYE